MGSRCGRGVRKRGVKEGVEEGCGSGVRKKCEKEGWEAGVEEG